MSKVNFDEKSKENFSKEDSVTNDMGLLNSSAFLDPV
jgi:hypothetical protein